MRARRRSAAGTRLLFVVLFGCLVLAVVGLTTPGSGTTATVGPGDQQVSPLIGSAAPGSALAAVGKLAVKGRAPRTGYSRDLFGQTWADVDRNGCDTRNDILGRDLTAPVFKAGTNDCKVLSGTLDDPYTGRSIAFVQGAVTSEAVQIDHVVALSDAWQKGAQGWDATTMTAFANDPLNLLAVDGPTNSAKSDGDAATWLPPNKSFRCAYIARQVAVKVAYQVWVTAAERAAMVTVLADCPDTTPPVLAPERSVAPQNSESRAAERPTPSSASTADVGCDIKGNISIATGERIYHVPGGESYDATRIDESKGERWFCSTADAEAAGWRASRR